MAYKYFIYSEEQFKEKNSILASAKKEFKPGTVVVGGSRKKFTQLSTKPSIDRFIDCKIVAEGEESSFTFTAPKVTKKGN